MLHNCDIEKLTHFLDRAVLHTKNNTVLLYNLHNAIIKSDVILCYFYDNVLL